MNDMSRMRLIERQQQILLGMRSPASRGNGQATSQGVPEGSSWLLDAKAQVNEEDKTGFTFTETSWGHRLKMRR